MAEKQLWSVQETAERWSVSPFTVRRLIDSGELRSVTIRARRLVPVSEIERCEMEGVGTARRRKEPTNGKR
jgi:excisionase family DNA binding protein